MKLNMPVRSGHYSLLSFLLAAGLAACCGCKSSGLHAANAKPPKGFTALFNGHDLTGWRGGDTFDPRKLEAMPTAQREAQIAKWTDSMREHWRAENGVLVNDGHGAYF